MTHRRRLTRGLPPARKAQGWMPVEVLASEKHTPTVVIPAVTPQPPAQTEVITEDEITPDQAARIREGIEVAIRGEYARESVPDLGSPDPADRTEYLRELGGDEFVFESVVGDLNARYLLDTSLPIPPRTAAPDPGPAVTDEAGGAAAATPEPSGTAGPGTTAPGAVRPPAGEDSGPVPADASPVASGAASDSGSGAVPPSGEDRDQTSLDAPEPVQDEPVAEHDCAEGSEA